MSAALIWLSWLPMEMNSGRSTGVSISVGSKNRYPFR